uniref:Putative ovule protein n=1 Tax=Solanum chacoense TaxID=4108 RepID=A0A0V0HHJ3_SOLCH
MEKALKTFPLVFVPKPSTPTRTLPTYSTDTFNQLCFLLYSVRQRGIEDFEVSCAIALKAELERIQLTYWFFFFVRKKKEKQVDETFRHSHLGLLCRHVLLEFSLYPSNKQHSSLNLQPNRSQLKNAH